MMYRVVYDVHVEACAVFAVPTAFLSQIGTTVVQYDDLNLLLELKYGSGCIDMEK